jgi:hypothetical protein
MALAALNVLKSKDFWTPAKRMWAARDTGRAPGRLPGGHVGDIADLKKTVMLCPDCIGKFNSARAEYVIKKDLPFVRGFCDGCRSFMERGHLLVHYTLANLL